VDDVASFLNLAKKTVYAMSSAGRIPAIKIGSVLRFDPIELAD
jgi:excisionase family DNA binding protein